MSLGVEKSSPAITAQGSERVGAAVAIAGKRLQTMSPESSIAVDPLAAVSTQVGTNAGDIAPRERHFKRPR